MRAVAREVGASRSAATNWTHGYKTYSNGVGVGFVPPLDPLAVRQISTRFLSRDERSAIADLRLSEISLRAIADRLGRSPSTISTETRRNVPTGSRICAPAVTQTLRTEAGPAVNRCRAGRRPSCSCQASPG